MIEAKRQPHDVDWFTPAPIVEDARAVMGGIDVDPASCAAANEIVQAKTYYDVDVDGLAQPWVGNVFLNPPFLLAKKWIAELCKHFDTGAVTQACVLTLNSTDTQWWRDLAERGSTVCLTSGHVPGCVKNGRITFWRADGQVGAGDSRGHAITYLGPNREAFTRAFAKYGLVVPTLVTARCVMCHAPLVGARADALYCTPAHRQAAWRARQTSPSRPVTRAGWRSGVAFRNT